ncbi:hypothetical protein [Xanthomonas vasicola]|uniref:hypothetical protein n=1 Tax=Xanthomonas vasicola TaxID=56459 RepID=UPI00034A0E30|nr:hypothetical protein [Xanthomonas vasicola]KFA24186.1 hypothetical protein KW5_0119915 [Xanthomonas vasicola pv. vasculorum NCPPB 1326]
MRGFFSAEMCRDCAPDAMHGGGQLAVLDSSVLPAIGNWQLAIGNWLLAIGYWLLAIGYWLLATGYWLLAIGFAV